MTAYSNPPQLAKPNAAFILSVIGGVFIVLGGFLLLALAVIASTLLSFIGLSGAGLVATAAIGVVVGFAVIVSGVLMHSKPESHVALGALVLVLSIVSFYTSFYGGFVVGAILGIVGGALCIAHKPTPIAPLVIPRSRMCPKCGRSIDFDVKFCPHCGAGLG